MCPIDDSRKSPPTDFAPLFKFPLIQNAASRFVKEYKPMTGIYIEVDTDPVNLM